MLERSALWKSLAASGSAKLEAKAVINGAEYPEILNPVGNRASCPDALSVGNCVSATLQFSVRPDAETPLPDSAAAVLKVRFTDGARTSEWMTLGTFYANRRTADPVTGSVAFQGFDAMRKADAPFPNLSGFPKAMNSAVMEIARNIGVEVDGRTWENVPAGSGYYVPLPAENEKMIKVLGYIGGVCGGNWIITPRNRLRLVPLISASGAAQSANPANVFGVTGKISTGNAVTVTGVSASNGSKTFFEGTETGAVVRVSSNPYITQAHVNALLTKYNGLSYVPYAIEKGLYDPAAEVGDYLVSREDVASVICQETAYYGPAFRGDISAPFAAESSGEGQSVSDAIAQSGGGYEDLSVRIYKFVNQSAVTIGDGQSAEILNFDYAAGSGQDVIFHAEVKHTTATTETGDATTGWTCTDAVLTVTYYINGAAVTSYHPVKTETDGANLLHLTYHFANGQFNAGNFRATLALSGGGVTIAAGDARAYIIGQGYSGTDDNWIAEDGLVFVGVESYPDKMDYITGETLDLTGLVVKAYYGDGTEKDVTADCVISPAHGDALEEGENVVNISYTEDDKEYRDSFSVYCNANHVLYIEVTTPPTRTEYFPGETLDLTGIVVKAFYEDGAEADVTENCAFTPADGATLAGNELITANAAYTPVTGGETFTAYFDVNVKTIRITAYPVKSDYFVGEMLDYTGLEVTEAVSDGTWNDVTAECAISPPEGTEVTEPGDIMVDVRYEDKPVGAFWVAATAVTLQSLVITSYPTKTTYTVGETLDYEGLEVTAYFSNGEEQDVTADCALSPTVAVESGAFTVTVNYGRDVAGSFNITVDSVPIIRSGDWWKLYNNGFLHIYCSGDMPDYNVQNSSSAYHPPWVTGNKPYYNPTTDITSIYLSDSVTSIGNDAFYLCANVEKATIPSSVTKIGNNAFCKCYSLLNVILPDSVASIGNSAFYSCDALSNVTLPNNITILGFNVFSGCDNLSRITIPDGVTVIGTQAFDDCSSLSSVVIPNSVTRIEESAFRHCPFNSINIPDSVTYIGAYCFQGCNNLMSISLPNQLSAIKNGTFWPCHSLESVAIPSAVTKIGASAFRDCDSLTDVYYGGSEEQWQAVQIEYPSTNAPLTSATIHYNSSGPS